MSTEALLRLLIGIVTGTLVPAATAVVVLVWKASRDWTVAGGHIESLTREVKRLVERIDVMSGQLDSMRLWRAAHQATADRQIERIDELAEEVAKVAR